MNPVRGSLCASSRRLSQVLPQPTTRTSAQLSQQLYLDFLAPSWHPRRTLTSTRALPRPLAQPTKWSPSPAPTSTPRAHASTSSPSNNPPAVASGGTPARVINNPRTDDDGHAMIISITPRAAQRLAAIAAKDNTPDLALRVTVESGGCHGFQYLMSLIETSKVDASEDTVFEDVAEGNYAPEGTYRAKVVMDEPSLTMLKGSSVDYTMELIGSQFKITGIPGATSSCGCGTSFDVAF